MFNDAIKEYSLYNKTKLKETPVYEVNREIQMCENGKRLMTTITDIIVTDKKEISADKFFRIYDLSNIGGSLLVTAEFQTKLDKKYNHTPLIHFPANPKVIYYSSYGDKVENGKDIYVRRKLPDNSWGQPQELPGEVNTPYDEDFPYMHPDGDYLYFSDYPKDGNGLLQGDISYAQEKGTFTNLNTGGGNVYSILDLAFYFSGSFKIIPEKLNLSFGNRIDYNRIRSKGGYEFSPRLALVFLGKQVSAKMVYSHGIQNISLFNKFSTGNNRKPNEDLTTEKIDYLDFSLNGVHKHNNLRKTQSVEFNKI